MEIRLLASPDRSDWQPPLGLGIPVFHAKHSGELKSRFQTTIPLLVIP
jgi:hypothetical protein